MAESWTITEQLEANGFIYDGGGKWTLPEFVRAEIEVCDDGIAWNFYDDGPPRSVAWLLAPDFEIETYRTGDGSAFLSHFMKQ